jgi:hypothetical protein
VVANGDDDVVAVVLLLLVTSFSAAAVVAAGIEVVVPGWIYASSLLQFILLHRRYDTRSPSDLHGPTLSDLSAPGANIQWHGEIHTFSVL